MGQLIARLDRDFARLYADWRECIQALDAETIYRSSPDGGTSCGEHLVRSARIVEQTFGGITANLWDDPFEWTLPERLTTKERVIEYLAEVEATRRQAFASFKDDQDLSKEIMTPSGKSQLLPFLLDTLKRARHHQQRAMAVLDHFHAQHTTDH